MRQGVLISFPPKCLRVVGHAFLGCCHNVSQPSLMIGRFVLTFRNVNSHALDELWLHLFRSLFLC